MKKMLNFEKISHLYLQQRVYGFKKTIQECLKKKHLLRLGKLCLNDDCSVSEGGVCLFEVFNSINKCMCYAEFSYIRDGYRFYFTMGYDLLTQENTSNIELTTDNRENGIYVYLGEELGDVLVCSL